MTETVAGLQFDWELTATYYAGIKGKTRWRGNKLLKAKTALARFVDARLCCISTDGHQTRRRRSRGQSCNVVI